MACLAADPDPAVRLRALGALAERGDPAALEALAVAAQAEPEGIARAEALTWLARAEPHAHVDLLLHALEDDAQFDHFYHPVIATAAVALAGLPSDAARTALLRACLRFGGEDVVLAIGPALRHLVLTPEVQPPPRLCSDPHRWQWILPRSQGPMPTPRP